MKDEIRIFWLTFKYWFFQGDDWKFARSYARSLVWGFKKNG